MFVGKCIELKLISSAQVTDNVVSYCTDSGIRCDQCDDTFIANNQVYGTTWWTTQASSAVVFAEATGSGANSISYNVVYGNRNFLPFFLTGSLAHFGSGVENYGLYNMYSIVDGQGVYITRNLDYTGTFALVANVAFDNGINGLVVHKTTHEDVSNVVSNNWIFDNGKTRSFEEGRQQAGGITINSGDYTSYQQMWNNQVRTDESDVAYQCFGTCELEDQSYGNMYCGGSVSDKLDATAFVAETNCTQYDILFDEMRSLYTWSGMPTCPQYTDFLNDPALQGSCEEPIERACCRCDAGGNTCDTTKSLIEPDVCCEVDDSDDSSDECAMSCND